MYRVSIAIRTLLLLSGFALAGTAAHADMLQDVTGQECVRGDCMNGNGTLELSTPWGKGRYVGEFADGEFDGYGRLEVPISFLEEEIYVGNWVDGRRNGRGKHWNGEGNLYIGQWRDDKRHGHGSYFFNLPEWDENRHTEFWLRENTENYTGDFVDGHYHGQGTYRWPDGRKYVGGFFASDKHGQGMFHYATGTARPQTWEHGELVR